MLIFTWYSSTTSRIRSTTDIRSEGRPIIVYDQRHAPRSSKLSTRREASSEVRRTESGLCNLSIIGVVYAKLDGWMDITVPKDVLEYHKSTKTVSNQNQQTIAQ